MPITVRTRQAELKHNPWQMLVICQMLNQTSWKQVDSVSPEFFRKWPTPQLLLSASRDEIVETIRPLGLYNRRTDTLIKFSLAWIQLGNPLSEPIEKIAKLPGVGKYALDSWKIFQLNDLTVEATDKVLVQYLKSKNNDTTRNPSSPKV